CLLTFKLPIPEAAHSDVGATQILTPGQIKTPVAGLQVRGSTAPIPGAHSAGLAAPHAPPESLEDEKAEKKKRKKKEKNEKIRAAWIGFIGRIIAQIVGALAAIMLGLLAAGKLPMAC